MRANLGSDVLGYVNGHGDGLCACCVELTSVRFDVEPSTVVVHMTPVTTGDRPADCVVCGDRFAGPILGGEVGYE